MSGVRMSMLPLRNMQSTMNFETLIWWLNLSVGTGIRMMGKAVLLEVLEYNKEGRIILLNYAKRETAMNSIHKYVFATIRL